MTKLQKAIVYLVIMFAVFLAGVGAGSSDKKEVIKEVPVEKVVEVPVPNQVQIVNNQEDWKKLKDIDDAALQLSAKGMNACSQGFEAVSEGDPEKLTQAIDSMKPMTADMIDLGIQRQALLKKLGY